MKVFIHDLESEIFNNLNLKIENDDIVVAARNKIAYCRGCFDCWLKTPGSCIIKDDIQNIGALLAKSDEVIIISENYYGGFSEPVKKVVDRSISFSLPFFTYRSGRLHHRLRYKNESNLKAILYGDFLDSEREAARLIVQANKNNMGYKNADLFICKNAECIGDVLI